MEILSEAIELAQKVCGSQKPCPGEWRMAHHCVAVPCAEGMLLYHTLTGELLLLTEAEWAARNTDPDLREALFRRRFLVPADFDENRYADQVIRLAKLMNPPRKGITRFTVFTTLDCNARCFYCYQMGRKRPSMSVQTAHDTAAYMARVSQGQKVKIQWYGGEPLYNLAAIDTILSDLRAQNIPYESTMISNGYLFDPELIEKAKNIWKLRWVQIPLDGTEEVYNRAKAFIYREGSAYRHVLENIGLLLDAGINVIVRLNVDNKNADDLTLLVEELGRRFGGRKGIRVYDACLMDYGNNRINAFDDEASGLKKYKALSEKIRELGISGNVAISRELKINACMADSDGAVTILPEGQLGKCDHFTEDHFIGSIYSDTLDQKEIERMKERREDIPACRECAYYPQCRELKYCFGRGGPCTPVLQGVNLQFLRECALNSYEKQRRKHETDR